MERQKGFHAKGPMCPNDDSGVCPERVDLLVAFQARDHVPVCIGVSSFWWHSKVRRQEWRQTPRWRHHCGGQNKGSDHGVKPGTGLLFLGGRIGGTW